MEVKDLYKQAQALGVCTMFKGNETVEELFKLFATPQGLEFYQKTGFPSLDVLRSFKGDLAQSLGIFIDAGEITLHGSEKVILVGKTAAKLIYDDLAEVLHNVTVMSGAKATVEASKWAVVYTKNIGGEIVKNVTDNAIVR